MAQLVTEQAAPASEKELERGLEAENVPVVLRGFASSWYE
jgi:hypothetical protein